MAWFARVIFRTVFIDFSCTGVPPKIECLSSHVWFLFEWCALLDEQTCFFTCRAASCRIFSIIYTSVKNFRLLLILHFQSSSGLAASVSVLLFSWVILSSGQFVISLFYSISIWRFVICDWETIMLKSGKRLAKLPTRAARPLKIVDSGPEG